MPIVLVAVPRLERWLHNFGERHGDPLLAVAGGALTGTAPDGSSFAAVAPFGRAYDGPPDAGAFADVCAPPAEWGVLLVRKGGFAVARLAGERIVESKVGQRHVQGRTKAGGQSQQRFARRRDNQARAAYEAAAGHAARIIAKVPLLVVGGDRAAVTAVLEDSRLADAAGCIQDPFLAVPDPRRGVLESAIAEAGSVRIDVTNA